MTAHRVCITYIRRFINLITEVIGKHGAMVIYRYEK